MPMFRLKAVYYLLLFYHRLCYYSIVIVSLQDSRPGLALLKLIILDKRRSPRVDAPSTPSLTLQAAPILFSISTFVESSFS